MKRHPVGICAKWRRGNCERDLDCFYRHPADISRASTSGSQKSPERYDEEGPRKRKLSNHQEENRKSARLNSSEENQNHFLVKQYQELKQQVENIQTKKENVQQGWMNPSWVRAPATTQLPVMQNPSQFVRQTTMNPNVVHWNQPQGRMQPMYQGEQLQVQGQFPVVFHQ